MTPTLRKPLGVLAILGIITSWAVIVTSFSGWTSALPVAVQIIIYAIAGIVWIAPMRPLLQWMETGSFKPPRENG